MKILVIRFKLIGDVILSSTICNSLRKSFPDARIDYLMYGASAPLFDHHDSIDNIITLSADDTKRPFRYLKRIWEITRAGYDIIIDTNSTAKSELISLFSRRAEYRIGRDKRRRGWSYTHRLPESRLLGDKIDQRLALLEPLKAIGMPIQADKNMRPIVSDDERRVMRELMVKQGIDFSRPVFALSVSAREPEKKWNTDYMCELASYCLERYQAQIILFSGLPSERKDVLRFHQMMGDHADLFSSLPSNSLRDPIALFSNCDFFFGNEGGPRHMAEAVGVPSVSIFSPSARLQEWLPQGDDRHRGLEWQDIDPVRATQESAFNYGDLRYFELYDLIKPSHVKPLLNDVICKHVAKCHDH